MKLSKQKATKSPNGKKWGRGRDRIIVQNIRKILMHLYYGFIG